MNTMKSFFYLVMFSLILSSCESETPYLISDRQVGLISNTTQVNQLKDLFPNDSIVEPNYNDRFKASGNDIYIYENGELSLKIQPRAYSDSASTISEIQIINPKYKTAKGLASNSKFANVYNNYKIKSIQNSFRNVIVDLKDSGLYLIIDKEEMPSNLKYDRTSTIEANQIPDEAKFKYFWFSFDLPDNKSQSNK